MRNLKKVLSLALAMVMLLGMMVVGAGAATNFTDASSIPAERQVAAAVANQIGVLIGDDDHNFNPDGTLTRAEAAVILTRLDLGASAASALTATDAATFNDVGTGYGWAKAYIDYCAGNGYILGDGKGHFMPGDKVTSVQFAMMISRVLGYDTKKEGVEGSADWVVKGAALARKAGLGTDVAVNNDAKGMTRADMAQMVLNALTAPMVEYKGMDITIGDVAFNSNATNRTHTGSSLGLDVKNTTFDGEDILANITPIRLCEEKFPDLKLAKRGAVDGFRRTYSVWTWKKVDIAGTRMLVEADAEFTAKKTATEVGTAINNATSADAPVYVNGKRVAAIDGTTINAALIASWTQNGRLVQVFLNEKDHKAIEKVVVIDTFVAQVNSVGSDSITLNTLGNSEHSSIPADAPVSALKNDAKVPVYASNVLAGVLTSRTVKTTGFTAGDLVTYTAAYDTTTGKYTIVADDVTLLENPVTGTLTAWKGSNLVNEDKLGDATSNFTVDSNSPYEYSANNVIVDSDGGVINIYEFSVNKSEINVYTDKYGFAIYVSGVEVEKNYAAVIGMGQSNQYGSETRGVTLLLPDNTTVEVTAKMSTSEWNKMTTKTYPDGKKNLVIDGEADLVTYTVDDKGIYSLTRVSRPKSNPVDYTGTYSYVPTQTSEVSFENGKSLMTIGGDRYYTTSRTIFMVGAPNSDNSGYTYRVYTGYAEAPSIVKGTVVSGVAYGVNRTLNRQIDVVYLDASGLINVSGTEIYFAFNKNLEVQTTSNGSFVIVPAVVDGEVTEVMIDATLKADWDGTGEKALKAYGNVAENDLYVIDRVVRNDAGIITGCTVKDKGVDILKEIKGTQGVIKAGYGVIGFGQANTTEEFWAYNDSSKGYYIDKDFTTITETPIGNFPTDKNDIAWVNGDSATKKVATLFVVEVEGNEPPTGETGDNEVAITVDIDDGVKSVTVGTTKLTADGNVNVTKDANVDVTVELNNDYKISKVTLDGKELTATSDKYTFKASAAATLKIETVSTKGRTLTLIGGLIVTDTSGKNGKSTVFAGTEVKEGTIVKSLVDGAAVDTAVYTIPAGVKVTVITGANSDVTADGALFVPNATNGKTTKVELKNVAASGRDNLIFTMPDDDLTIHMKTADKLVIGSVDTTALTTVVAHKGLTLDWRHTGGAASDAFTPESETSGEDITYYVASDDKWQAKTAGGVIQVVDADTRSAYNTDFIADGAAQFTAVASGKQHLFPAVELTAAATDATVSYQKGTAKTDTAVAVHSNNKAGVVAGTMLKVTKGSASGITGVAADLKAGDDIVNTTYTYQMPTTATTLKGGFKVTLIGVKSATVDGKAVTNQQVVTSGADLTVTAPDGMVIMTENKAVNTDGTKKYGTPAAASASNNYFTAAYEINLDSNKGVKVNHVAGKSGDKTQIVSGTEGTAVTKLYVLPNEILEFTGTAGLTVSDASNNPVDFTTYDKDGFDAETDYDATNKWVKLKITGNVAGWKFENR